MVSIRFYDGIHEAKHRYGGLEIMWQESLIAIKVFGYTFPRVAFSVLPFKDR